MKIATLIFRVIPMPTLRLTEISLALVFLINLMSGCSSVIQNTQSYYETNPREPINWREYETD